MMTKTIAALVAVLGLGQAAMAQTPRFAVDPASPATTGGAVNPSDVLLPGPSVSILGTALGLTPGADILADFSFGAEVLAGPIFFSVDRTSVGLPGTAVFTEALSSSAAADVYSFLLPPGGTNTLVTEEVALGLTPGLLGDNVSALTYDSGSVLYFGLGATSAVVTGGGMRAVDIYQSSLGGSFSLFRNGVPQIGLDAADELDGLILLNGGTAALFSLSAFSPSAFTSSGLAYAPGVLGQLSPADVLFTNFDGTFSLFAAAADLGLQPGDEVDALAAAVPEPTSLTLLGVGGLLAAWRLRARRRRS
jgi:hypothetical protein